MSGSEHRFKMHDHSSIFHFRNCMQDCTQDTERRLSDFIIVSNSGGTSVSPHSQEYGEVPCKESLP